MYSKLVALSMICLVCPGAAGMYRERRPTGWERLLSSTRYGRCPGEAPHRCARTAHARATSARTWGPGTVVPSASLRFYLLCSRPAPAASSLARAPPLTGLVVLAPRLRPPRAGDERCPPFMVPGAVAGTTCRPSRSSAPSPRGCSSECAMESGGARPRCGTRSPGAAAGRRRRAGTRRGSATRARSPGCRRSTPRPATRCTSPAGTPTRGPR